MFEAAKVQEGTWVFYVVTQKKQIKHSEHVDTHARMYAWALQTFMESTAL